MTIALLRASPYLAVILACLLAMRPLARSRWTWQLPALGILLWQVLASSLVLSGLGLCLAAGLAPSPGGELWALTRLGSTLLTGDTPGWLGPGRVTLIGLGVALAVAVCAVVAWHYAGIAKLRRRHRSLLTLVSDRYPPDPSVLVVRHPDPVAYCLPGRRASVVVSTGILGLLDRGQLAAVLAHESAHARERHDLVLLPFAALRRTLPRSVIAVRAHESVSLLVEMRADDRALRAHPAGVLYSALQRCGASSARVVPAGALGLNGTAIDARLRRITQPSQVSRPALALALALAVVVVATLVSHLFLPW